MSSQLTDRQQNVYDMIRGLIVKRGYGPTVREIGEHFGIKSPNGVMCHLRALERKGLITRSPNKSRAIELTQTADRSGNAMPMAGIVSARPTKLSDNPNDRREFSEMLFAENRFTVQVSGDYLVDAHIADGDFVVIEKREFALPGQLVVAQTIQGESLLRFWHPESDRVRMEGASPTCDPVSVRTAVVQGVAVGIVRVSL